MTTLKYGTPEYEAWVQFKVSMSRRRAYCIEQWADCQRLGLDNAVMDWASRLQGTNDADIMISSKFEVRF